ncbi:MAG: DUF3168 domain-containing protein [Hyphomicrobiaceae bacterium]
MPASANWALQESVYQALQSDGPLVSLLGGAKIYDRAPRDAALPYVTFGQSVARDWSTGTEEGEEHILTLHIWSEQPGRKETQEIIKALRDALNNAALGVTNHHLINIRYEFSDTRRDPEGETFHGIVRYRAVTEPVS